MTKCLVLGVLIALLAGCSPYTSPNVSTAVSSEKISASIDEMNRKLEAQNQILERIAVACEAQVEKAEAD